MVDFNSEATIGTPAVDIVRILILQRRSDLIEALEDYNKQDYKGLQCDIAIVRAMLVSLFIEIQSGLQRRLKPEIYTTLKAYVDSDKIKDILQAIISINEYLDDIRLIRLDNKQHVKDKTNWEAVNLAHGY